MSVAIFNRNPDEGDRKLAHLQCEHQRLQAQLSAQTSELDLLRVRFARYEAALRGSQVTVFTQDRDLRYTSISNPMFGRAIEDILGRTDDEIIPAPSRAAIVALKRDALATGQAKRAEVSVRTDEVFWHDLHVEPLRDERGDVVGMTCAAIDITDRKEHEAHLRLLLREITHRSKNLLAVIQSMARQTAHHTGTIDGFLTRFYARLQAMAASHDLLIRESWYGASLHELVRSQLGVYLDREGKQVTADGPPVALKPDAAQNLGLAFHELAANASKYGALSVPEGHVSIAWRRADEHAPLEIDWIEQSGPKVRVRRKRGFGSLVIERNLTRGLDAVVDMSFEPDGLRCHIVIPAEQVLEGR